MDGTPWISFFFLFLQVINTAPSARCSNNKKRMEGVLLRQAYCQKGCLLVSQGAERVFVSQDQKTYANTAVERSTEVASPVHGSKPATVVSSPVPMPVPAPGVKLLVAPIPGVPHCHYVRNAHSRRADHISPLSRLAL
jgi:hypothetical protein